MTSKPARIRWTDVEADREARGEIVRSAWHGAYHHLLSESEIDAVFDGDVQLNGSWSHRRTAPAGTIVAAVESDVVGLISLALLETFDRGEVVAFYVLPQWQGKGVGEQLWAAGLGALSAMNCSTFEVWTMAEGAARGFYEAHGCVLIAEGTVDVGAKQLAAVGYERTLTDIEPIVVPFV